MRPLAEELERKRALFMDDASFITEVREGRALAPGMDPEAELRTLRLRFDNFRRDFKVRPNSFACLPAFVQAMGMLWTKNICCVSTVLSLWTRVGPSVGIVLRCVEERVPTV